MVGKRVCERAGRTHQSPIWEYDQICRSKVGKYLSGTKPACGYFFGPAFIKIQIKILIMQAVLQEYAVLP
jgi:hypothetical protein